jgi:hypothetical protein
MFRQNELAQYTVAIVTAKMIESVNAHKATAGRTVVLIDERPDMVKLHTVSRAQILEARVRWPWRARREGARSSRNDNQDEKGAGEDGLPEGGRSPDRRQAILSGRRAFSKCAFEALLANEGEKIACRTMVGLLALAHDRACEAELADAIEAALDVGEIPDLRRLVSASHQMTSPSPRLSSR